MRGEVVTGYDVGAEICHTLGISPHRVKSIRFDIKPTSAVTVTIERFVTKQEIENTAAQLVNEEYELRRRKCPQRPRNTKSSST